MTRRGFTLVEVLVGIVLASVVALLAYGTLRTSIDTNSRIEEDGATLRSELAWKALLTSSIRNVRGALDYGAPTVLLVNATAPDGRPADRLVIVTASELPPLGPDDDWRVSIYAAAGTVAFVASPVHDLQRVREVRAPDGITGVNIEALAGGTLGWQESWPAGAAAPYALRITFWDAEGPRPPSLLVSLPLVAGP